MTALDAKPGQALHRAPVSALRGVQRDANPSSSFNGLGHDAADALALIVWSLFLAFVALAPVVCIFVISQFQ